MSGQDDSPQRPAPSAGKPSRAAVEADVRSWVAQHWDAVFKLLDRLTVGNRHDAEDLAQETFLRAMERHDSFEPGTNLRAWLLRIATNAFLDRQRRRKVLKIGAMPEDDAVQPAAERSDTTPGRELETRELHAAATKAIGALAETPRAVFLLRVEQEMSFREIADVLGTTEETARWHMMQARKQLLARLNGKL